MDIVVSGTCRSYEGKRYKCGYVLLFFEKSWKTWFLALVRLTYVKDTSACVTKDRKNESTISTNHQNNCNQKTYNWIPKGSQNGANIDAKRHRKSMPKLLMEKIRKIIKINVSLNSKIIETHCKNNCF